MRARLVSLVIVAFMLGCGAQSSTGNGNPNGGNGGGSGGNGATGGAGECLQPGASLDCTLDCANLDTICKNDPSTMMCVGVCIQLQTYCASFCKTVTKAEDVTVMGCLQTTNGDCAAFSACLTSCDGNQTTGPAHMLLPDMAMHD